MSFADDLLKRLFPAAGPKGPEQPVRRALKRTDAWRRAYGMAEPETSDFWKRVGHSYHMKLAGIAEMPAVHLHKSPYSNGFLVYIPAETSQQQAQFWFDWLFQRVRGKLLYQESNADTTTRERSGTVHETERYYLKPQRIYNNGPKAQQFFGNILIEFTSIDGRPAHVKLMANVYSDANFEPPLPFSDLVHVLFPE